MAPRISIEGLCKSFASPVLKDVDLEISPGSIRGLVGENGAGKSTLIHIICGLLNFDRGSILIDGTKFSPRSRKASLDRGIALVSQELSLIDTLSVRENILLTALPTKQLRIDPRSVSEQAEELIRLVGLGHISPQAAAASLSLAEKQLVELAKALSLPEKLCNLLILDEPTSALTTPQIERVHQIIKERASSGTSVIYVSHRLEDVIKVCDSVSVLKDGEVVLTSASEALSSKTLIRAMSGEEYIDHGNTLHREVGPLRLKVNGLSSVEFPTPISLECHQSEILGIAGLAGAGRSELVHTIFGLAKKRRGEVVLHKEGTEITINNAGMAVRNGMALIAEDRKTQGLFMDKSLAFNTTIAGWGKLGNALTAVLPNRERRATNELLQRLKVKYDGVLQKINTLSGGNQQKVLIARWLNTQADVWLLDEPTRGVDVSSKMAIHEQLRNQRDRGALLIIVSSELEELMALCDRILVLSEKEPVRIFKRGEWTKEQLLEAAFSGHSN